MLEMLEAFVADREKLEVVKLIISVVALASLIGIFAGLLSMRMTVCNQLYARWQSLLFKFADVEDAHTGLARPYARDLPRTKAHFIVVAYLNLFEEAFRYREARYAFAWHVLPEPFWQSIVKSMTKQFSNYRYLRSFWEQEQDSWSDDFNAFVRRQVLPHCPAPASAVVPPAPPVPVPAQAASGVRVPPALVMAFAAFAGAWMAQRTARGSRREDGR
ncbi:hypothetical protein dqs_2733 [Azoarcus olearius]|uniref:hypothetical protein n=1 Tax=Azoarcus sp. (strain BH72) TaxID=418699 RepID=UPI00080635E3|nr:hypothetical protein [Azoarcus olearius]ANQ85763.1 hypothetical protein dqs_2733 [Azoarcus olearius]